MMKKGIIFGALLLLSTSLSAEMLICNKYSCQSSKSYDTKEILNVVGQMLYGGQKEIVLCEADQYKKTCLDRPITFSGRTNLMAVQFKIPFARVFQVNLDQGALQMQMDYQLVANQYYPVCKSVNSTLSYSISSQGDFILNSPEFECQITELGSSKMNVRFTLDYMNVDDGVLGGAYQTTVKGDVVGGGSGYVLLQLSDKRSIEMPRPVPTAPVPEEVRHSDPMSLHSITSSQPYQTNPEKEPKLVDWDWDNIKEKWNSFSTKFMKILYLEPLDD
jgi:hypothetical protein